MLFLFVIMLFNLQQVTNPFKKWNFLKITGILLLFLNFFIVFFSNNFYNIVKLNGIIFNNSTSFSSIFFFSNITSNGLRALECLYTVDNIIFIFLTLLLYFTMLGAITLAQATKQ